MSLVLSAESLLHSAGQTLRYEFISPNRPAAAATVRVASAFRSTALAAFQTVTGSRESFLLSGHEADGTPDRRHRHAFYLPDPDETGRLAALYVVSPEAPFCSEEIEALRLLKWFAWNGPKTRIAIALVEENDLSLKKAASLWETVTPYVPPQRFYGTHGKHHLAPDRQLLRELDALLPRKYEVIAFEAIHSKTVVRQVAKGVPGPLPRLQHPLRESFRVKFRSSRPIGGPLLLGHSTHFGLGRFCPSSE